VVSSIISICKKSFGYVVEGADFLRDIKEDDIIVSAKVTDGLDKLVLPKTAPEAPAASE
jgi:cyclophilin family peptidyl-prolyl cis-trans isomerase